MIIYLYFYIYLKYLSELFLSNGIWGGKADTLLDLVVSQSS